MTQAFPIILVRILAAYLIFTASPQLGELIGLITHGPITLQSSYLSLRTLMLMPLLILGVFLWKKSIRFSTILGGLKVLGPLDRPSTDMISAGSFLIGLYWFAEWIPETLIQSAKWINVVFTSEIGLHYPSYVVSLWTTLIIAILLMGGSRKAFAVLHHLRRARITSPD